jgi:hypothetical protein
MTSGSRHAHIEEAAFLVELPAAPGEPRRQFALLDPRKEDSVELETLRPMERQQVHASMLPAGAEPSLQVLDKLGDGLGSVVELGREADEAGQVVLAGDLALAQAFGNALEPSLLERDAANLRCKTSAARSSENLEQLASAVARQ